MEGLFDRIQESIAYINKQTTVKPIFGIVLGTGLGNLVNEMEVTTRIPYENIPNFPTSTVESHAGELVFGTLATQPIVAMSGRFHFYEGYTMQQVTFPIRVMKFLGIKRLVLSNASGGLNPNYNAGDLVAVRDHINLQPENPLRGVNDERIGPRFPDMLHTYDKEILAAALTLAKANNIKLHTGVYVSLQGPNLETPAEYRYMNIIGGDIVGMSTVPEVIVARHMDLPVFVISVVSNQCFPIDQVTETTVAEVIKVAQNAEPKMTTIVKGIVEKFT